MKMVPRIKQMILFFLLSIIISAGTSCTKKLIETSIVFNKTAGKMLIAGDSSEFKDRIREKLVGIYKNRYNIDIINIKKLKTIDSVKYDLILIMDTTMARGGFNPSARHFLDTSRNREKTVLFMTAGDADWEYSYKGIDAVTSASCMENTDKVIAEIKKEIESKKTGL